MAGTVANQDGRSLRRTADRVGRIDGAFVVVEHSTMTCGPREIICVFSVHRLACLR
jgi:hypothetical protein